jgi:predicted ATPase
MKISINNFKSIGSLANYEMRPLTILSGANSSGKSSFIQLLLLLKQTIEDDSAQRPLKLDGRLYPIREYIDILKDKNKENKLKVKFIFNKSELSKYNEFSGFNVYNVLFDNYELHISITFDETSDRKIIVSNFEVKFIPVGEGQENFTIFENNNSKFSLNTNLPVLVSKELLPRNSNYLIKKISYTSFIPSEIEFETIVPEIEGFASEPSKILSNEVPKLEGIKAILKDFFVNLNYVGPYRKSPQDGYPENGRNNSVGINGANVAEVLCELSESRITFYKILELEEGVSFVKTEATFLNAVKYWLCERFKLCSDIYSKKEADLYVINVVSLSGITSTIKHVGFGISQVLPIIVEGLRICNEDTLVLEQPEVHLHPKVQSSLTDFFISLIQQGKNVIIETHSDHLITRLRRRIAEDQSNQLDDKVLLTFVEVGSKDVLFRNITINDFGIIELPYPEGFIERTDTELKAILKAQMNKRLNQQK